MKINALEELQQKFYRAVFSLMKDTNAKEKQWHKLSLLALIEKDSIIIDDLSLVEYPREEGKIKINWSKLFYLLVGSLLPCWLAIRAIGNLATFEKVLFGVLFFCAYVILFDQYEKG